MKRLLLLGALAAAAGCDESLYAQPLPVASSFTAATLGTNEALSALPSFADERGGGVFVDLAGRVTRVRPNGSKGVLEPHPSDDVWPGPASGVFALSGGNSLVATTRGVFAVSEGWLLAPVWQAVLPAEGLHATTTTSDGTVWLAHDRGLFRLARGALGEFKVGEQSLTGVTSVASAPSPEGAAGLWFVREGKLFVAAQTAADAFTVTEVPLADAVVKDGILEVAGLSPSPSSAGQLWLITRRALLTGNGQSWRQFSIGANPRALKAAGRFAWLQAGDALYRLDADLGAWQQVEGLSASATLLGADAAGSAWVRVGEQTLSIAAAPPIRVRGVYSSQQVFDGQLVLQATLPAPERDDAGVVTRGEVSSLRWQLDELASHEVDLSTAVAGEGPGAGETFFSLGGVTDSQVLTPVSFAALQDGWHTLKLSAVVDGAQRERQLHFLFSGAATATVSWETDVKPLFLTHCAPCHVNGPAPTELKDYAEWKANAATIADRVRTSAMPPGGMDPASISTIVRWANGGTLP